MSTFSENAHPRVVVAGVGCRSAVGTNLPVSASSIRAGISRSEMHPFLVDKEGQSMIVTRATYLCDSLQGWERLIQLGEPAAEEAWSKAPKTMRKTDLVLALPQPREGLSEGEINRIRNHFESLPWCAGLTLIHGGNASGIQALEYGWRHIRELHLTHCMIGAMDSHLDMWRLEQLDYQGLLRTHSRPHGVNPGEGAGFCLLVNPETFPEWETAYEVKSVSISTESNLKPGDVNLGEGFSVGLQGLLGRLESKTLIGRVFCDLNSQIYRVDEYGLATARFSDYFESHSILTTPADCWGDVGAASGIMFTGLAIQTSELDGMHGLDLIWTGSDDGVRGLALCGASPKGRAHASHH